MSTSSPLPLGKVVQELDDADVTRYLTVAGLVMVLYDNMLTIYDEYQYIWKATPSFAKYAFLVLRYGVPCMLLAVVHETCGFNHFSYSNHACQTILVVSCTSGVISLLLSHLLVLRRVLALWTGNKQMKIFLYSVYVLSACVAVSLLPFTFTKMTLGDYWAAPARMCALTTVPPSWAAVWGAPIFFEITVVTSVIYNAIATPRSAQVPLHKTLQKNGIAFFLTVMLLRLANMVVAATARPSLVMFAVVILWSSITIMLNRSILRLSKAEMTRMTCQDLPLAQGPVVSQRWFAPELELMSAHEETGSPRASVLQNVFKSNTSNDLSGRRSFGVYRVGQ